MGVAYYLWRSIYSSADVIRGMTFDQTFLYVALGSSVFILLKTYTDWYMSYDIREGRIIMDLIKPIDYQFYVLAFNVGFLLTNFIGITFPTVILLAFVFKVKFTIGLGLLFVPLSVVFAFLISFALDYIIGLSGFYTESIWGISMVKEIIVTFLSGALIPLQFFPDGIQKILLLLPFQAVYHTPLMLVTHPQQPLGTLVSMLLVQAFWVVVLFVASRMFFFQAVKILRISGG